MDRLSLATGLIKIIGFYILLSCSHQTIKFIHLDDTLKHYSDSSQAKGDLIGFLYLKPDLIDSISKLNPTLLTKSQSESQYFFIAEKDKFEVNLTKEYDNVQKVVEDLDYEIILFLKEKIGVTNPKSDLNRRVQVYKNTAFVEFFGSGSVHALTFDLKQRNHLMIGIAYIIIQ